MSTRQTLNSIIPSLHGRNSTYISNLFGSIKLYESSSGINNITIKSPASLSSDITFTLPSDDGDADQVLTTNGSGVLSWETVSGGGGGESGDITGVTFYY